MRPSDNLKSLSIDSAVAQDDNWMLSYIDVFVLITTLFLMLLVMNENSFGTVDQLPQGSAPTLPATATLASTQQNQTQVTFSPSHASSQLRSEAASTEPAQPPLLEDIIILEDPPKPAVTSASAAQVLSSKHLQHALEQSIEEHGLGAHVQVLQDQFKTRLEIQSRVLFDSGNAFLTRSGEAVLEKLLPVLKEAPGNIVIEGHTDNQPINTPRFPSNWNLAAARASEVLEFLVSEGFDAKRFRAVSYGDTQPLVDNSTESNRRKNRRVSLVIEQAP